MLVHKCYNIYMYYLYLFRCRDKTLYCGVTNNLLNREKRHNSGRGAKYTRNHGPGKIVYSEHFSTLSQAMRREVEVKKFPKLKKEKLISRK